MFFDNLERKGGGQLKAGCNPFVIKHQAISPAGTNIWRQMFCNSFVIKHRREGGTPLIHPIFTNPQTICNTRLELWKPVAATTGFLTSIGFNFLVTQRD